MSGNKRAGDRQPGYQQSGDKQLADEQIDDASLFQQEMSKTNIFKRNSQAPRFNSYEQRDKPRATQPLRQHSQHNQHNQHNQHKLSDAPVNTPDSPAINQTAQGESVLFVRSGLQRKVIKHLKRGAYPFQSVLDLHGMKITQAETMLAQFLSASIQQNLSCVLIIHGKGYHSENRKGVLKPFTINWLKQCPEIKAFCSANPKDGGTGAVYVLLKRGLSAA